jgi:hypothetical protein
MRRKSVQSNVAADLRLIVSKPEPEHISKENEALSAILDRAVTYERYLSRDSVGGERMRETVKLKVTLRHENNPLSEHIARQKLLAFLTEYMGCTLAEAGTSGDRIAEALYAAEDKNLISVKMVR